MSRSNENAKVPKEPKSPKESKAPRDSKSPTETRGPPDPTETFETELAAIKAMGSGLKGPQREFYTSIVQRLENNVQVISDLRAEHSSLRSQLQDLVKTKSELGRDVNINQDLKDTGHRVNLLKMKIDRLKHQKQIAIDRQKELQVVLEKYQSGQQVDQPDAQRIQDLKNKLANANIKNGEASHMQKVYGKIINLLERQKMHWSPLLEQQVKDNAQRERDIQDLEIIARDSKFSRNTAKNEFVRTETQVSQSKLKRDATLELKKAQSKQAPNRQQASPDLENKPSKEQPSLNSQTSVMRNRINKAQREKKEEKFRTVTSTIDEIREYFGTTNSAEIKSFFDERKKTTEALQKQITELKSECDLLEKKASQTRASLEETEFSSAKGVGGNRLIAEGNKIFEEKTEKLNSSRREMESIEENNKSIIMGVMHLADVLALLQTEDPPEEPIQLLKWAKEKVEKAKKALSDGYFDFNQLCNQSVFNELLQRSTNLAQDIQKVDSSKRAGKRAADPMKRAAKETKGDVLTRVMGRQATKTLSAQAAGAKAVQAPKKPGAAAPVAAH